MKEIITTKSDGSSEVQRIYSDEEVEKRKKERKQNFWIGVIIAILGFFGFVIYAVYMFSKLY